MKLTGDREKRFKANIRHHVKNEGDHKNSWNGPIILSVIVAIGSYLVIPSPLLSMILVGIIIYISASSKERFSLQQDEK